MRVKDDMFPPLVKDMKDECLKVLCNCQDMMKFVREEITEM